MSVPAKKTALPSLTPPYSSPLETISISADQLSTRRPQSPTRGGVPGPGLAMPCGPFLPVCLPPFLHLPGFNAADLSLSL